MIAVINSLPETVKGDRLFPFGSLVFSIIWNSIRRANVGVSGVGAIADGAALETYFSTQDAKKSPESPHVRSTQG